MLCNVILIFDWVCVIVFLQLNGQCSRQVFKKIPMPMQKQKCFIFKSYSNIHFGTTISNSYRQINIAFLFQIFPQNVSKCCVNFKFLIEKKTPKNYWEISKTKYKINLILPHNYRIEPPNVSQTNLLLNATVLFLIIKGTRGLRK